MSAGNRKHTYRVNNEWLDNQRRRQERNHHVGMLLVFFLAILIITMAAFIK